MKGRTALFAAALCLALLLAACGAGDGGDPTTVSGSADETEAFPAYTGETDAVFAAELAGYVVVRPETAGDDEVRAGIEIRDGLKPIASLTLTTDWVKRGEEVPVGTKEILVGNTNRPESVRLYETLRMGDFAVGREGDRIVIVGGSEASTRTAVAFFLRNFTDAENGRLLLPRDTYVYATAYAVDSFLLNGVPVSEYTVCSKYMSDRFADTLAAELADALTEATGRVVTYSEWPKGEKRIEFVTDAAAGDDAVVETDGERICVRAADASGLTYAYAFFRTEVLGMDGLTGTGNTLDVRITEPLRCDLRAVAAREPRQLFVSPDGSDEGDGSAARPYRTIETALARLQKDRKLCPDEIVLADGDYYLTDQIRIDAAAGSHLTIRAQNPGRVRLIGGISVDMAQCLPVTDPAILERVIDKNAAGKLMMLDVSGLGIELSGMRDADQTAFYVGEQALTPARWPNSGYLRCGSVLSPKTSDPDKYTRFISSDASDRARLWSEEGRKDLYVLSYLYAVWRSDVLKVTDIDVQSRTVTVDTTDAAHEGFRFFFFNILEELDAPGECWVDREKEILYFYPPKGGSDDIFIATLAKSMILVDGCADLTLKGLSFRYTRCCAVEAKDADGLTIADCTVLHTSEYGLRLNGERITVDGCEIADTASGGIVISGGDRTALRSGESEICNCVIHDINRSLITYRPGVYAASVGLVIRNNEFCGSVHEMIAVSTNNVLITHNEFHDCVTESADMGVIYFGRDPSLMGTEICYNYFHDNGNDYGTSDLGQWCIYVDDGNAGAHIHHNLFYKPSDYSAVRFHAAQFSLVEYNIFAETTDGVHNQQWSGNSPYEWLEYIYDLVPTRRNEIQPRIKASGMESERWRTYYEGTIWEPLFELINPDVRQKITQLYESGTKAQRAEYMSSLYALAGNVVADNVYVDLTRGLVVRDTLEQENNVRLEKADFVAYGTDFALTEAALAKVREVIPAFEDFPMADVGPQG